MTPQTFAEQEYMRVIYYVGIYPATLEGLFCAGKGHFTISNGKGLAQVRTSKVEWLTVIPAKRNSFLRGGC
jgi:hypothetical protein